MKIKFDFGTQLGIPKNIISSAVSGIINANENEHNLKAGKCTVYLTFYDKDGLEKIVYHPDKGEANFIIRPKKYQRKPKNTEYIGKINSNPDAYLYRQYES